MKLHFKLAAWFCVAALCVNAQKTESISDINSKGSAFPFGTHIFEGEKPSFQAFDRNGNSSLYVMEQTGLTPVKSWNLHGRVPLVQASVTAVGQTIFSVVNDSAGSGIWQVTDGKAKLVYANGLLNEVWAVYQQKLYVNITAPGNAHHVYAVDNKGTWLAVNAFDIEVDNMAIERMFTWQQKLWMLYRGKLLQFDGNNLKQLDAAAGYTVKEAFAAGDQLYIGAAEGKGKAALYVLQNNRFKQISEVCPNEYCVDAFRPLVGETGVFFISNSDKSGESIYELTNNKVERIQNNFYHDNSSRFSSYCVSKDGLFFCSKPHDGNEFSVWQYAMDTLIPYQMDNARNPLAITTWGEDLLMLARHDYYDIEPIKLEPFKFPSIKFYDLSIMETTPKGRKIGQIEVDKKNSKKLKYDIVGGNDKDAFIIDPYDGSIYVQNPSALDATKNPVMNLEVKVITSCFKPVVQVPVNLLLAKPIDMNNLEERFLFYPDFDNPGYLLTKVLENGERLKLFNQDLKMVDELVVTNKSIYLKNYPSGIYIINAQNSLRNYYQKLEVK